MWVTAWQIMAEQVKNKCKCVCQCDGPATETLVREKASDLALCSDCYKEWIDPTRIWVGGRDD